MKYDLVIIGAGPAGMSAAVDACKLGLSCLLLDEQLRGGGQIYRNVGNQDSNRKAILGPEYQSGLALLESFESSTCKHISGATVWQISADKKVFYSVSGKSCSATAGKILISTGAQERPMPILGWTLPGVMTAGGAQILLKNPGLAAEGAIFAGCGPLLYLVVWQYLKAGIKVKAVLDTTKRSNYFTAAKKWRGAFAGRKYLFKGIGLLRDIKLAGIPIYKEVNQISALADDTKLLNAVSFKTHKGEFKINTEHLFLHQGIIPQVNLAMASGCEHQWSSQQLCWTPKVDEWGQSSQQGILIAGDGLGIGGAIAAALRGKLAALQIGYENGKLSFQQRNARSKSVRRLLVKELAFRPFIDALYRPAEQFRKPTDNDVVICRCEEITLNEVKSAFGKGCIGPNQLKSFTRCGMGPCQGRQCGNTVTEVIADLSDRSIEETGYYRLRSPIKPLNLNELASLYDEK
tara:strand:- start:3496 stop:4881 length:1386 start_codon:yes stop_codon:yes gene_type:complete